MLDRQHGEPPALCRAPVGLEREEVAGQIERVRASQNAASPVSTRPFSGDLGRQHGVEGGDAVGGHEQ
jgi:hypothetical protein